jgi:hypothetical protein
MMWRFGGERQRVSLLSKVSIAWPKMGSIRSRLGVLETGATQEVWGSIWKLRITNVEKKFLWKACHEILPTKGNLQKRKITTDALCPFCVSEEKTCLHVLWDCPAARDAWEVSLKKFQKYTSGASTFCQLVEDMFKICDEEEICFFVGLAR